jgi:shikimate dehydrogenase
MSMLRAGLIGENISRTRLPAALQIMCDYAGLDLQFDLIDTFGLARFNFDATEDRMWGEGWTGGSVTHPWKTNARRYVADKMHRDVASLGASNLLTFDGGLRGVNTDYTGFLAALDAAALGVLGDVVIMGAGGVAEALGPAIRARQNRDARVEIFDLNVERAHALCVRIGNNARVLGVSRVPEAVRIGCGVRFSVHMGPRQRIMGCRMR